MHICGACACAHVFVYVHIFMCLNCVMHAVCVTVSMYSVWHHCYMYHVFLYSSQCPHARPTVADIYPKQYGAEVCAVCYMKCIKLWGSLIMYHVAGMFGKLPSQNWLAKKV